MSGPPWIRVSSGLPESGVHVLVVVQAPRRVRLRALYAAPKTLLYLDNGDEDDFDQNAECDEKSGDYFCLPGWYEACDSADGFFKIEDEVTHWMPLPAFPEAEA